MALGTPVGAILAGIRPDIAPVQPVFLLIDGDPERVAATHDEYLRASIRSTGWEEVAFGDGVSAVRFRMDAEYLAAEVIRVRRGALGVPGFPALPLIDRSKAIRGEGVGIITGRPGRGCRADRTPGYRRNGSR